MPCLHHVDMGPKSWDEDAAGQAEKLRPRFLSPKHHLIVAKKVKKCCNATIELQHDVAIKVSSNKKGPHHAAAAACRAEADSTALCSNAARCCAAGDPGFGVPAEVLSGAQPTPGAWCVQHHAAALAVAAGVGPAPRRVLWRSRPGGRQGRSAEPPCQPAALPESCAWPDWQAAPPTAIRAGQDR